MRGDMSDVLTFVLARYNYWIVIVLMMTGLYIVFSRGNLVKTVVGLNIFQTSVFIFYITVGKVAGGTAPILIGGHGGDEGHGEDHGGAPDAPHAEPYVGATSGDEAIAYATGEHADAASSHAAPPVEAHGAEHAGDLAHGADAALGVVYSNPLPHVLILTAIVVGVATTAVGLAIAVRIREAYGTVEEDALERMDNQASGYPEGRGEVATA